MPDIEDPAWIVAPKRRIFDGHFFQGLQEKVLTESLINCKIDASLDLVLENGDAAEILVMLVEQRQRQTIDSENRKCQRKHYQGNRSCNRCNPNEVRD